MIIYRLDRILIAQYLFILGTLLIIKFKIYNDLDTYDPYAVLFLYYLGLLAYNFNMITKKSVN